MLSTRLALRALCAISLAPFAAAAGPLVPTRASQLVTVRAVSEKCPLDDPNDQLTPYQLTSMSTSDGVQQPFAIPDKQVFVITHVHIGTSSATPGSDVQLYLFAVSGSDGAVLAETSGHTSAGGQAFADIDLPSGIAVRPGHPICAYATEGSAFATASGFFAKDK